MSETKLQSQTVSKGTSACTSAQTTIQSEWGKLVGNLEAQSATWDGAAKMAFINAKSAVDADIKTIMERLGKISEGLGKANFSLMQADDDARRSLDNVAGGTGGTGATSGGGSVDVRAGLS